MATKKKRTTVPKVGVILALISLVVVVAVVMVILSRSSKEINNFQSCKDAGGAILESFPEQCVLSGKSFTNDEQSNDTSSSGYVGLTEDAALSKASLENKPARVVERDGEALPATADYSSGRLNLYVRDGNVYKVQVEGEESR